MIREKEIRIIFFGLLFVAIAFYDFTGIVVKTLSAKYNIELNQISIVAIGRYVASLMLIFLLYRTKLIIKLSGVDFIGGKYEGTNSELDEKGEVTGIVHETFLIYQSLLRTSISGISNKESNEFYSSWKGDLIERKDNHYTFSLEVENTEGKYFGVMVLRIEHDNVTGFTDYFSSGKIAFKEKLVAKKVSNKTK